MIGPKKYEQRSEKFYHVMQMIEASQTYAFRIIALLFLIVVVIALFVAVFLKVELTVGFLTAITILTVLPILIIRAFDISVLNLTKEGIMAEMSHKEDNKPSAVGKLLTFSMPKSVYDTLLSLTNNSPDAFKLNNETRDQLIYLENIGLIKSTNPLPPQDEGIIDRHAYFSVTDNGLAFLNWFSKLPIKDEVCRK